MSNPTGINQYTRNGAGALRTKTGKFYHGTNRAFSGPVKPSSAILGGKSWATTGVKMANMFATMAPGRGHARILEVKPGGSTKMQKTKLVGGGTVASSTKHMSVVRTLPTLRKPSRK